MLEWKLFTAGCVGALAPELVRFYRLRHSELLRIRHVRRYVIVSVLFVALGGAVAVLLEASSLHAAFYMGISLPAIVSTVGGRNRSPRASTKVPVERGPDESRAPFGLRAYLGALFPRE
jgi:uncharacterized membrane protein YfcA